MFLKLVLVAGVFYAVCTPSYVKFSDLKCTSQQAPAHGKLECKTRNNTMSATDEVSCKLICDSGYDVTYLAAKEYICHADGKWTAEPEFADYRWPNCSIYGPGQPVP